MLLLCLSRPLSSNVFLRRLFCVCFASLSSSFFLIPFCKIGYKPFANFDPPNEVCFFLFFCVHFLFFVFFLPHSPSWHHPSEHSVPSNLLSIIPSSQVWHSSSKLPSIQRSIIIEKQQKRKPKQKNKNKKNEIKFFGFRSHKNWKTFWKKTSREKNPFNIFSHTLHIINKLHYKKDLLVQTTQVIQKTNLKIKCSMWMKLEIFHFNNLRKKDNKNMMIW